MKLVINDMNGHVDIDKETFPFVLPLTYFTRLTEKRFTFPVSLTKAFD